MDSLTEKKILLTLPIMGRSYRTKNCDILFVYGILNTYSESGIYINTLIHAKSYDGVHIVPLDIWDEITFLIV